MHSQEALRTARTLPGRTSSSRRSRHARACPNLQGMILSHGQCKERHKLLKEILKENDATKSIELREKYNKMRNEITNEKRASKRNFHTTQFEKNKSKSSKVWQDIRKLVNVKSVKTSSIKLMRDENIISDQTENANTFDTHFSKLGEKV